MAYQGFGFTGIHVKYKCGKVTDIREARQRKPVTYPCIFPYAMKNPFVAEQERKPS